MSRRTRPLIAYGCDGKTNSARLNSRSASSSLTLQQIQVAELRARPGERLDVLTAGRLRRHLHQPQRSGEVALQLARIRDARIGARIRTTRHDFVEGVERFLVPSELEQRVAGDGVVPGVVGPNAPAPPSLLPAPLRSGAATDTRRRACAAPCNRTANAGASRAGPARPRSPATHRRRRVRPRISAIGQAARPLRRRRDRLQRRLRSRAMAASRSRARRSNPTRRDAGPCEVSAARVAKRGPAASDDSQPANRAMRAFRI